MKYLKFLFLLISCFSIYAQANLDLFRKPLPIHIPQFSKYAHKKCENLFGRLKTRGQVGAVDAWVSVSDAGLAADHAGVFYAVDIPKDYLLSPDMQAAVFLSARGSEDYILLKKDSRVWAPMLWEYNIIVKSDTSPDAVIAFAKELATKYPSLGFNYLEYVGVLTATTSDPESMSYTVNAQQVFEIKRMLAYLKNHPYIETLEHSVINYRMPSEFSDILYLDKKTKNFDINAFRTVSINQIIKGWQIITKPSYAKPFGKGSIAADLIENPEIAYTVVFKYDADMNAIKEQILAAGARLYSEFSAINTLVILASSEEVLAKIRAISELEDLSIYE